MIKTDRKTVEFMEGSTGICENITEAISRILYISRILDDEKKYGRKIVTSSGIEAELPNDDLTYSLEKYYNNKLFMRWVSSLRKDGKEVTKVLNKNIHLKKIKKLFKF